MLNIMNYKELKEKFDKEAVEWIDYLHDKYFMKNVYTFPYDSDEEEDNFITKPNFEDEEFNILEYEVLRPTHKRKYFKGIERELIEYFYHPLRVKFDFD